MKMLTKILASVFTSTILAHGEIQIGSKSAGKVTLPESFYHENEGLDTLLVMPRKDDMEGPVSMRITALKDIKGVELNEDQIKEMLLGGKKDRKISTVAGKIVAYSISTFTDPNGIKWNLQHRSVYSEGIIFTMTTGTIAGRSEEPQCKELEDKMDSIIGSLSRK
jgi:hypothetical protein